MVDVICCAALNVHPRCRLGPRFKIPLLSPPPPLRTWNLVDIPRVVADVGVLVDVALVALEVDLQG